MLSTSCIDFMMSVYAIAEMTKGAVKALFKSGLSYGEVTNLIPVKPLGGEEHNIRQIYETRLTGVDNVTQKRSTPLCQ